MTTTTHTTPRIYVASLTDYNAGTLHGVWVDLDSSVSADDIMAEVSAMLEDSPEAASFPEGGPAEEWAIHDYEGFGPLRLSEWESFHRIAAIADAVEEHGPAFLYWLDMVGSSEDPFDPDEFLDAYRGEWGSLREWAEESLDDQGVFRGAPDLLVRFFDFDAYVSDLENGGALWTAPAPNYGVYVFVN